MNGKLIRYSLAMLIGVGLICTAFLDSTDFPTLRSQLVLAGIGLIIIAMGIYRIVNLLKGSSGGRPSGKARKLTRRR